MNKKTSVVEGVGVTEVTDGGILPARDMNAIDVAEEGSNVTGGAAAKRSKSWGIVRSKYNLVNCGVCGKALLALETKGRRLKPR